MRQLGPARGEDPTRVPPLDQWQPISDREWALRFIREDGSEDYDGFQMEFQRKHPALFHGGIAYMPGSVDFYVRRTQNGHRVDLDWELMRLPRSEGQRATDKRLHNAHLEQRRAQFLEKREAQLEVRQSEAQLEKSGIAACGKDGFKNVSAHERKCGACKKIAEIEKAVKQE